MNLALVASPPLLPPEFFTFFGGSTVAATPLNIGAGDPLARPGQTGTNGVLRVDYNVFDFGGLGQAFQTAGPQDWSNYTSFDFWFYGTGSGLAYQAEISDNRSDPNSDTSERFDYTFLGDAGNLASRLEGANKIFGTGILVSRPGKASCGSGMVVFLPAADMVFHPV